MGVTGAGVGVLATGLAELVAARFRDSLLDRVGRVVVDTAPLPLVELGVRLLGTSDKPALRANVVAAAGLAGGLVGSRLHARTGVTPPRWVGAGAAVAGVGAILAARGRLAAAERRVAATAPPLRVVQPLPAVRDGAEDWPGVVDLFTPVDAFYVTDVNMRPPLVDLERWRLWLDDGTAEAALSHAELVALGLRERDAVLACVHDRPGWDRLGHQRWSGLPVATVLSAAGLSLPVDPSTADLVATAVDGHRHVLPLDLAIAHEAWVVLGMGGRALTPAHGFPARVMVPGLVGQYNGVKWLDRLAVVPRGSVRATWVERGWPRAPRWVRPMARIDHPATTGMPPRLPARPVRVAAGSVTLTGTAWAPPVGVSAVEVAVDGGDWVTATLADDLGPASWRRWRADVDLAPGRHRVACRVTTADGTVQTAQRRPPLPDGATGHHTVRLHAS